MKTAAPGGAFKSGGIIKFDARNHANVVPPRSFELRIHRVQAIGTFWKIDNQCSTKQCRQLIAECDREWLSQFVVVLRSLGGFAYPTVGPTNSSVIVGNVWFFHDQMKVTIP